MKIQATIFLIFLSLSGYAQKFKIEGKITNINSYALKNGDTISLKFLTPTKIYKTTVVNSTFKFEGNLVETSVAMLNYKSSGVKLLVDTNLFKIILQEEELGIGQFIYKREILTHSPIHLNYSKFVEHQVSLNQKKSALISKMDSLVKEADKVAIKQKIKNIDFEINQSFKDNAIQNPNNVAAAYVLTAAPDFSYHNYWPIYVKFTEEVKKNTFGKMLFEKLIALKSLTDTKVNADNIESNKLPTFDMIDTNGKSVKLNTDFFSKQKYTLIEFWASWCGPCKLTSTELRAKQRDYLKKGLKIVGFSLDNDLTSWKKGILEEKSNWQQFSDLKVLHSPLIQFLKITAIPANIIVDKDGNIIAKNIYGENLDNFLLKN